MNTWIYSSNFGFIPQTLTLAAHLAGASLPEGAAAATAAGAAGARGRAAATARAAAAAGAKAPTDAAATATELSLTEVLLS